MHGIESSDTRYGDRSFGSTRYDEIGFAQTYIVYASMRAWVEDAHADTIPKLGPRKPYIMDICPAAMSAIIFGIKNGLNRGLFSGATA